MGQLCRSLGLLPADVAGWPQDLVDELLIVDDAWQAWSAEQRE